jgi:hypothetical protein
VIKLLAFEVFILAVILTFVFQSQKAINYVYQWGYQDGRAAVQREWTHMEEGKSCTQLNGARC